MGTTQPIRNTEDLEKFIDYYKTVHPSQRNYTLVILGLNTALRISDILGLKWEKVYDFKKKKFHGHVYIREQKTGKKNAVVLNHHVKETLGVYLKERHPNYGDYIFTKNTDYSCPLSRSQAYRIIKHAAECSINQTNISCHSLRKTFGYHAWKKGIPPALLMDIYNHSSYQITKKYLGIRQEEKDSVFMEMNF